MNRERIELILGTAVLALGIIILIFVLSLALPIAQSPGEFIEEQVPEDEEDVEPPRANFYWSRDDLTVNFIDESKKGDNPISSWYWEFGDDQTSNEQNPTHTYDSHESYSVRLEVDDGQGNHDSTSTQVNLNNGDSSGSTEDSGDFSFEMGNFMMPLTVTLLTFFMYVILFLVGAAITKAGWNLIKPKPKTIKVRVKPKDLEIEPVEGYSPRGGYGVAPYPQQPGAYAASTQEETEPPPPGVEPMCPSCGADIETGWKTCPTCGASL